ATTAAGSRSASPARCCGQRLVIRPPSSDPANLGRASPSLRLVRLRLILLIACFALALAASAGASASPWPIKPFNLQNPTRANLGVPRPRFLQTMLTDGLQGPGTSRF